MVRHVLRVACLQAAERPPAKKRGQHFLLVVRQRIALRLHHARGERVINSLGSHLPNGGRRRRLRDIRIPVAAHAVSFECADAGLGTSVEIRAGRRSGRRLALRLRARWRRRLRPCNHSKVDTSRQRGNGECSDTKRSSH